MGGTHPVATLAIALVTVTAPAAALLGPPSGPTEEASAPGQGLRSALEEGIQSRAPGDQIAREVLEEHDELGPLAVHNMQTLPRRAATGSPDADPARIVELLDQLSSPQSSPSATEADARQLAQASAPVRGALADVLASFLAYRQAARDTFDTPEAFEAAQRLADAEHQTGDRDRIEVPDVSRVLTARGELLASFQHLEATVATQDETAPVEIDRCPDVAIDLTAGDDTYATSCALVVDAAGDDTYTNNAGGTNVGQSQCGVVDYEEHRFAAALADLDGNDTYGTPGAPANCGVNGGGWGGAGLLYDAADTDRYAAGETATNGGSLYGVGTLVDGGGDDLYTAADLGVNGGGIAGVGTLVDRGGDDTYRAETRAANGGSYTGLGLLRDEAGDDTYEAGSFGTNGGTVRGVGTLLDARGNDTYRASHTGINGGSEVELLGFLTPIIPPSSGIGVLVDEAGQDDYRDQAGGTGPDETLLRKGIYGVQVDVPHLPGDTQGRALDQEAKNPQPHVVVGVPDAGINPYHEQFYRPNLTEHPCTYIPNYPCDVPALNLTLDAPDFDTALQEDAEVWENVEPGQWYWIPQTSFVAVACEPGDTGVCILSCNPSAAPDPPCFEGTHGVETTSSVVSENEDALIAFKEGDASLDMFLNRGLPVDLYASSFAYDNAPHPVPGKACSTYSEFEIAGLYVKSTHDFAVYPTTADCWSGAPNVIEVTGGLPDGRVSIQSPTQPELTSYFCRPIAQFNSTTGIRDSFCGGGTSAFPGYTYSHPGGPTAAGAISKVIQAVREDTGYTGKVTGDVVDPLYGDDGLGVGDLRDAVNRTASFEPPTQYEADTGAGFFADTPRETRWAFWGWGFYDGWVANATVDHLLDEPQPAKPLHVQAYMDGQQTIQDAYFGGKR